MWCLKTCTQLEESSTTGAGEGQDEPIVDLVAILQQIAWRTVRRDPPQALSLGERICGINKVLVLEVDKSFISVSHGDTLQKVMGAPGGGLDKVGDVTERPVKQDGGSGGGGDGGGSAKSKGTTFLFESQFHNDTGFSQTYSFKTERQTRSMVELSVQRGFTLGTKLELNVKIPTGVKGCKLSGKLGGQMGWSFSRGKISRQEEAVTWSVDSHVEVAPKTTGVATLAVQECRSTADFYLDCVIRPRVHDDADYADSESGSDDTPQTLKFPVFVRRRASGELLQIVNIPRSAVVAARPGHFKKCEGDASGVTCTLRMQAHSVCAVNQRVWLKEATLVPGDVRPAVLHQDSVIIENNGTD